MHTTHSTTQFHGYKTPAQSKPSWVKHYLKLMFFSGPKVLLTSRISVKCAVIMVLMCTPSLLACAILTLPELIFQSPHQQAYFYFAQVLNEDPTRWFVLFLAGICSLMSLAVPATMAQPNSPIRY